MEGVVRVVVGQGLSASVDKACFIAVLAATFERSGSTATGTAAVALLLPMLAVLPSVPRLLGRFGPGHLRAAALAGSALALAAAAVVVSFDLPVWVTVGLVAAGFSATGMIRPAAAALLPRLARSTDELVSANLWFGHTSTGSALLGPLVATGGLAVGGARAVLAVGAMAAGVAFLVERPVLAEARRPRAQGHITSSSLGMVAAVRELRGRRGTLGVVAVSLTQYLVFGAFGVLAVILSDAFGLPPGGPGLLNLLLGVGGVGVGLASRRLVRRRLAPLLGVAMVVVVLACVALGSAGGLAVAAPAIVSLGVGRSTLDVFSRVLLQRSASPQALGGVFAVVEMGGGVGRIAGSLCAQLLLLVASPAEAVLVLGLVVGVVGLVTARALDAADRSADVPVVVMADLAASPLLGRLHPLDLESVARAAGERTLPPGTEVIVQGSSGHEYFVVTRGTARVTIGGHEVRMAGPTGAFGEVALLTDSARTATVTAVDELTVLVIDRASFLTAVVGTDRLVDHAWSLVADLDYRGEAPVRPTDGPHL